MFRKLRTHLTFANVMSALALFIALSTGTAYAANTIGSSDIIDASILPADLSDAAVTSAKLAPNAVTGSKVIDFGLTNRDVGVLFAEVNSNGTVANSSGSVTASRKAVGQYVVDFSHVVTSCTAVATIGGAGTTTATGEVNVADRAVNDEAVFVDTNTSTGAAADRPFRLVVVC